MEKASGIMRHTALGRMLMGDLFGAQLRLRTDERTRLMLVLNRAVVGHSTQHHPLAFINAQVKPRPCGCPCGSNPSMQGESLQARRVTLLPLGFQSMLLQSHECASGLLLSAGPGTFGLQGALVEALLSVSPRADAEGKVQGAFCFLQIPSTELSAAMRLQRAAEEFAKSQARAVAYLRQEIRGPLDGLKFARSLMQVHAPVTG